MINIKYLASDLISFHNAAEYLQKFLNSIAMFSGLRKACSGNPNREEKFMVGFVIGIFVGTLAGFVLAAIFAAGKDADALFEKSYSYDRPETSVNKPRRAYAGLRG